MLLYADIIFFARSPAHAFPRTVRLRQTVIVLLLKSLSARLLIMTIFFVMVGEVLIFVPSVARFRMTYFEGRLATGYLATLAVEASSTAGRDQDLINKLLLRTGAQGVALYRADGTVVRLERAVPPKPDFTIDLTHPAILLAIRGSFLTLLVEDNSVSC